MSIANAFFFYFFFSYIAAMIAIDLIARHIDIANLSTPIHEGIKATCAFTGRTITKGCRIKDAISANWTDWDWIRHGDEWVSVEFVLCIADCIPSDNEGSSRCAGLRNFSFVADVAGLCKLKNTELLDALLNPPNPPFVFVITEGGKKHVAFKAQIATERSRFPVATDVGCFEFDRAIVDTILPAMQRMYSVKDPEDKQQRTWFTKEDIATLEPGPRRIAEFGLDKWVDCVNLLRPHQKTLLYRFLLIALTRDYHEA